VKKFQLINYQVAKINIIDVNKFQTVAKKINFTIIMS